MCRNGMQLSLRHRPRWNFLPPSHLFDRTASLTMRRSTLRLFAVVILVLVGAPLAMHVVVHDLRQDHHHDESTQSYAKDEDHSEHEHPIVSSATSRVLTPGSTLGPSVGMLTMSPAARSHAISGKRDLVSLGALRLDDDIGLQSFLSTFLI